MTLRLLIVKQINLPDLCLDIIYSYLEYRFIHKFRLYKMMYYWKKYIKDYKSYRYVKNWTIINIENLYYLFI